MSVAYAAVDLAGRIFSDLSNRTALLLGAGETIELVARHLNEAGLGKLIVANRTLKRAETLADQFGAEAILLADVTERLPSADIVISSTASQLPILGKGRSRGGDQGASLPSGSIDRPGRASRHRAAGSLPVRCLSVHS